MDRSILKGSVYIFVLVVFVIVFKFVAFGGARLVTLRTAPPLSGVVSQSLAKPSHSLPVVNKDYVLSNVRYFDNKNWVVASVDQSNNKAALVLRSVNGSYVVVMGPGTVFPNSDLSRIPADAVQYLSSRGVGGYGPATN